jgi:hypothetical protein
MGDDVDLRKGFHETSESEEAAHDSLVIAEEEEIDAWDRSETRAGLRRMLELPAMIPTAQFNCWPRKPRYLLPLANILETRDK